MNRYRYRLRFQKRGDLRWIGHRDLLRTMERLFRRAGLPLSQSEGFHPKPRLSFPSALAVGIEALDEVLELELTEPKTAAELGELLSRHSPPGLTFSAIEPLVPGAAKPQVERVRLEVPVPLDRAAATQERMARFLASPTCEIERPPHGARIDIRPLVESLTLADGVLTMILSVKGDGSARPREILEAIGLADLEDAGAHLTRTQVELRTPRTTTNGPTPPGGDLPPTAAGLPTMERNEP